MIINKNVTKNTEAIDAINNADTGILATAKGYTDTEVAKNKALIDAINNVKATHKTPLGNVLVAWKKKDSSVHMQIELPSECYGILTLPDDYTDQKGNRKINIFSGFAEFD